MSFNIILLIKCKWRLAMEDEELRKEILEFKYRFWRKLNDNSNLHTIKVVEWFEESMWKWDRWEVVW